jgi:aminopeptidase N
VRRPRALTAAVVAAVVALGACTEAAPPPTAGPTRTPPVEAPGPAAAFGPDDGLSIPRGDPVYPNFGNPSLDVLRYELALTWTPSRRELAGTATLTIRAVSAVREIALDFSDAYAIDAATVDGARVATGRRGDNLVVAAALAGDARALLVVRYHGTPRTVPMPSRRGDFPDGLGLRPADGGEAWTMQEPYGAFTWYPANDHPSDEAVYDVSVTVPTGWAAVAHGHLVDVRSGPPGDTYRWQATDPAAAYVATLAIGRYTRVTDTGPHGLPLTYWVRTGKDEPLLPALRRSPALIAWLERRFGPYPFPSAGVVVVDSLSAMETQEMVTYGARLTAQRNQAGLNIVEEILLHEYAHQWFGDAVTPTDWRGMWLNEGFAMYAQWLWSVDQRGESDATWVKEARTSDQRSRPVAGPPGHPHPDHFGEQNVYFGPALMLREIHRAVGDDAFFALARDWVGQHRHRNVDRATFVRFVNRHTGRDFTALINRWLDSPTTPRSRRS